MANATTPVIQINEGNVGIGTASPGYKLDVNGDITSGSTTKATSSVVRSLAADTVTAGFEAHGASQGTGYAYVGQSSGYGGGMFYNGDGTPAFATGETADRVSFYRKSANANTVVFDYAHNSNTVNFKGEIYAELGSIVLSGTGRIQGIDTVSAATDAANKAYVDAHGGGLGPFLKDTTDTFTGDLTVTGGNIKIGNNTGFVNSGSWTTFATPSGNIQFGPANTTWAHIYTDRPNFYFNKNLYVSSNLVYHTGNIPTWNQSTTGNAARVSHSYNRTDTASYPVVWMTASSTSQAYSCAAVTITSSAGRVNATTFNGALTGNATTATTAADSNLLDGINSTSFLRSDVTDYQNNTIYQRGYLVNETGYRNRGVYGSYDSYKTNHIWSMGTAYKNSASGTNFGNLYGLAYKHINNATGGNMAGGHQMVWCINGTGRSAMGENIWTSGNAIIGGTVHTTPVIYSANQSAYALKMGASNSTAFDQGIKLKSDSGGSSYISINARSEDTLVLKAGKVGIGTPSPQHLLHISDDTGLGFAMERTGSAPSTYTISNSSARITHNYVGGANGYRWQVEGTMRLELLENGNLYLNGSTALKVGGGSWGNYSDERVKKDISNYTKGLDEILSINPVTYKYNGKANIESEKQFVGIIAQEIKEVLPSTVEVTPTKLNDEDEFDTDLLTFDASELTFTLINAVKELKAEIEELKKQINK